MTCTHLYIFSILVCFDWCIWIIKSDNCGSHSLDDPDLQAVLSAFGKDLALIEVTEYDSIDDEIACYLGKSFRPSKCEHSIIKVSDISCTLTFQ